MGFFSWLFPKPADRIAKAKKLIEEDRFAEARNEVLDLTEPEAVEVRAAAEGALVRLNLEKAIQKARAGDEKAVQSHIDLAERFHDGSMSALFEETAAQIRALDAAQRVDAVWSELAEAAERRARLGTDPGDFTLIAYEGQGAVRLFFGSGRPFNLPGLEYEPRAEWFLPNWMSELSTADEATVVSALKKRYPEQVHEAIDADAGPLCEAIHHLSTRAPERAVMALLQTERGESPALAFELGRAAAALGQHNAAFLAFDAAGKNFASLTETADEPDSTGAPRLIVDGISTRLWQAATAFWGGDRTTAGDMLEEVDIELEPYLATVIQIEVGDAEVAAAALERIPEDDAQYPQMAGVVHLKESVARGYEDYPILREEGERGSQAWTDAVEALLKDLQGELDAVLESLNDEDEGPGLDEDDDSELESEASMETPQSS